QELADPAREQLKARKRPLPEHPRRLFEQFPPLRTEVARKLKQTNRGFQFLGGRRPVRGPHQDGQLVGGRWPPRRLGKERAVGLCHSGSDPEPLHPFGRQMEVWRDDEPATGLEDHAGARSGWGADSVGGTAPASFASRSSNASVMSRQTFLCSWQKR